MSGYYIFKFEKVLLILRKVVMFFHFFIEKRGFFLQNSAVLDNTGEKEICIAKMTISQKLFEIFNKIKQHIVSVFYSYQCAKFEHFWSSYSISVQC